VIQDAAINGLQTLVENYYAAWLRFHPEAAVDLGVAGHSEHLTPCNEDNIGALISLDEKLLGSLDELDNAQLDDADCLEVRLMYGAALLEIEALTERDWRRRQPAGFLPINAIYQLTLRPVADLHMALSRRLSAIPAHLREARTFLSEQPTHIPLLWLESAITEAQQGAIYLRSLRQHPRIGQFRLDKELEQAAVAVEHFAGFLKSDLAPLALGKIGCGKAAFERMLRYRHGLDISAQQLHKFGEQLFNDTLASLRSETQCLRGDDDIAAMTASLQTDVPPVSQLLSLYRDSMIAAREFVVQHKLVNAPQTESLKVVETPAFLRHQIPFAAYLEPTPNDPQQQGYYYVTLPEDDAALGEHNRLGVLHTCVHEAWPGHHLQFVTANLHPRSSTLPRLLNPSATLYEGWALYCEQLMQESGFLPAPESRFVLLRDRLWRALRVMLDVELHTRDLSVSEAVERMQQVLGFSQQQALGEITWYTMYPTVPMSYAVGWALINATRERLQVLQQPFEPIEFHNKLLAEGSVPLSYVIQAQFGEPLWQSVKRKIFA